MNIARSFLDWMDDNGYGAYGVDLFIGGAPLDAPNDCWWVLAGGGTALSTNRTGEKQKQYVLNVFYRDKSRQDVYENLQALEEAINSDACTQLDGYETVDLECLLFPSDQDLDVEDRTVGLLEVTCTTYL